jgi:protein-tyrosine phosphatase
MAEGVFRHLSAEAGCANRFVIDSAGTRVRQSSSPPDPRALAAAGVRGIDIRHLRSRAVTAADPIQSDLVLAMDESTRQHLLNLALEGDRDKIRLFLEFAPETGLTEIPDPFDGGPADYEHALDLIWAASTGLLAGLHHTAASSPS